MVVSASENIPTPPDKGARNMETILEFISNNQALSEVMTDKLHEHFDSLILLYREGRLSECNDV